MTNYKDDDAVEHFCRMLDALLTSSGEVSLNDDRMNDFHVSSMGPLCPQKCFVIPTLNILICVVQSTMIICTMLLLVFCD